MGLRDRFVTFTVVPAAIVMVSPLEQAAKSKLVPSAGVKFVAAKAVEGNKPNTSNSARAKTIAAFFNGAPPMKLIMSVSDTSETYMNQAYVNSIILIR